MLASTRHFKRPYQQVLLTLWICISSIWTIVGLTSRATEKVPTGQNLAHHSRDETQTSLFGTGVNLNLHSIHEDVSHPRLHQRPLPLSASAPEFPNVPVRIRLPTDDGSHITEQDVQDYIDNVWDLGNSRHWRTECDGQERLPARYEILHELAEKHETSRVKYFFALDLYNVLELIPRLMGTVVQAVKLLGPEKCAVSIIEGRSTDGTYAVLLALKQKLETIGTRVYLEQSSIDPHGEGIDRIGALSELRNLALKPLLAESENSTNGVPTYSNDTIINFINDVAVCPEDIYELLFQHVYQNAHQTCGMDWVYGGDLFYDSWVSRSMSGDLFFEIPQDVTFAFGKNMFWDHPVSKQKFEAHQPFQVYSCWGGMVTLSSAPFIDQKVVFRNSTDGECYAGEPTILAKDLWRSDYGKILTVPTVNLGYNSPEGSKIKKRRGYVHTYVETGKKEEEWKGTQLVDWKVKPPGQVKCIPGWGIVSWTEP